MLDVASVIVTHTGLYASGSPNTHHVLLKDLDTGLEQQNRKLPVYVPFGGSIELPLTDKVMFSLERGDIFNFRTAGLVTTTILYPGSGSVDNVNIYRIYVSPVNGNDITGDGSIETPYLTINKAASTIPAHGNSYSVWADEKYTIYLGPGRYVGPTAVIRQKRRSVSVFGDGAIITHDIQFIQDRTADWPFGAAFAVASMPAPWAAIGDPLATFEFQGVGGGMEGGQTSNNLILLGKIFYNWGSAMPFLSFCMIDRCQFKNNFEISSTVGAQALTMEINDASFRDGVLGSDGTATLTLKAQNSQLLGRIGPSCVLAEIDNCRFGDIRRDLNFAGGPAAGTIVGSPGVTFSGVTNCGFAGATYHLGATAGVNTISIDEDSLGKLLTLAPTLSSVSFVLSGVKVGTTIARPTALVPVGFRYFDTTLGIPIWRFGIGWVNGAGVFV